MNQSEEEIIRFISNNKSKFTQKLSNVRESISDSNTFNLFGETYEIKRNDDHVYFEFDHKNKYLFIPNITVDQEKNLLKEMSKKIILASLDLLHEKYRNNKHIDLDNVTYKTRYMTSRYGSCNKILRTININLHLIHYDKKYLEYVFLHEICHLEVANHSADFYKLFEKLCPNYKLLKRELKSIYRHR